MAWQSRSHGLGAALTALAALAASPAGALADDEDIAEVDVVVVPFSSSDKKDGAEAASLSAATVEVYQQGGATALLAGVSGEEILTLSGCSASDDECLASLPDTLGAGSVVFGTLRVTDSKRRVVLVIVERGSPRRRASVTLAGESTAERELRFRSDLERLLSEKEPNLAPSAAIEPAPEPPPIAGPEPSANERPSRSRWDASAVGRGPWIVAAAGAGAMATGGLLLLLGERKQSQVDSAETETVADFERLESLEGQARLLYTAGDVLVVGGLITAAVGAGLIFHQGHQRDEEPTTVTVSPFVLRGGGGLVLSFGASP